MPDLIIPCQDCGMRLKVPDAVQRTRTSVTCPRCKVSISFVKDEEFGFVEGIEDSNRRLRRRRSRDRSHRGFRPSESSWLWIIAAALCPVLSFLFFMFMRIIMGPGGLPRPKEGPEAVKYVVLAFMVLVGIFLMIYGTNGIRTRRIWARWIAFIYTQYTGAKAQLIGAGQCFAGALITGVGMYGLLF